MKKFSFLLMFAAVAGLLLQGCDNGNTSSGDESAKSVGSFSRTAVVEAVAGMYSEWESTTAIPDALAVSGTSLTLPQYQYAMAKLIVNLKNGDASDIDVLSYKAADHPDRDSYDAKEISVFNGAANGSETEDLANIASRMISTMQEKGQIPNQTLFTRDGSSIAFSTNRATVTFARAIASYKKNGTMPDKVSTEYLSAAATLKAFAEQFVTYLDVWDSNVAETLSADGSHCSDNNTAWEYVHFVPIPHSGGDYADGKDQYDSKYQPYHTITVDGTEYTAAQCWGIAMKGILDLITVQGSALTQTERNVTLHTLGNGESLSEPIPSVEEWFTWGKYPWYESTQDNPGGAVKKNGEEVTEVDVEWLLKVLPWHLTRSSQLGMIGNFQTFGEDDATLILSPYSGHSCAMRQFLIAARFYKYLLDNNITDNVYDAVKDVKFDADLYGNEPVPFTIDNNSLSFEYGGGSQSVSVTSLNETWTATASETWLTVSPASGAASQNATTVTITAAANDGGARSATVTFATASKSIEVAVAQDGVPSAATIKDFAEQYVTIINTWKNTTGTCNYYTGIGATTDTQYTEYDVADAHYIPTNTTIIVGGVTLSTADMLELALRSYLLLRGYDGNSTTTSGAGAFATVTGFTMSSELPETHSYTWGAHPFNETGSTTAGSVVTGNGGEFRMGDPSTADGVEKVKVDALDNWAQRNANYPMTHSKVISNLSGYNNKLSGYYGCFSAQRGLITYAYFFKYMIDNNLSDAQSISADQTFTTCLFKETE